MRWGVKGNPKSLKRTDTEWFLPNVMFTETQLLCPILEDEFGAARFWFIYLITIK